MTRLCAGAVVLVAAVAVAGCGSTSSKSSSTAPNPNAPEKSPPGDIPDNQVYVPYKVPAGHLTLKVPEGWAQTKGNGSVTFTDKLNSVAIQSVPAAAPLSAAAAQRAVQGLTSAKVSTVKRPAGAAVHISYLAKSKPDPVTGKVTTDAVERYVFFHNGRRAILTLSGAKAADNVDPWKIVSSSVRWTP
jgi:hypothetical protein